MTQRLPRIRIMAAGVAVVTTLIGCATSPPPAAPAPIPATQPEQISTTTRATALLRSLKFNEVNGKWELVLPEPLLFRFDEHTLTDAAAANVERLGASLADANFREVIVVGHTDSVGSREHNERLSLRRAQSVAAALKLDASGAIKITVLGVGSSVPIASNKTAEGRAENRRVSIIVEP
jgi:outer membrane protein OmpA-like peptidoglycan-associated protein